MGSAARTWKGGAQPAVAASAISSRSKSDVRDLSTWSAKNWVLSVTASLPPSAVLRGPEEPLGLRLRVDQHHVEQVLELAAEVADELLLEVRPDPPRARLDRADVVLADAQVVGEPSLREPTCLAQGLQPGCADFPLSGRQSVADPSVGAHLSKPRCTLGTIMADKSSIEWTDATWNFVTGCRHISPGCDNCYADALSWRLQAMGVARYRNGFELTIHEDQLDLPRRWRDPRRIFVNSMSDLFHKDVPLDLVRRALVVMSETPRHTYQILTKRADRLRQVGRGLAWPPNVWVGVSIENQTYAFRAKRLREVPAAVHFLSVEPLLGPVRLDLAGIQWVIVGGESGPHARPVEAAWVRSVRDQAARPRQAAACWMAGRGTSSPTARANLCLAVHP